MTDFGRPASVAPLGSKYCVGCAVSLHISARNCPRCGAVQAGAGERDRVLAVVLALLVGGFGIHKFYLGRVFWGILYLLFCWTFVPALVAFIEGIIYAFTSDEAFRAKYG